MKKTAAIIGLTILLAAFSRQPEAFAQEKPTLVPLRVQLVVSRQIGEKKISSLPYALWVTANGGKMTNVRMGVQVPVATTMMTKEGVTSPSYNYRDVGTNIDCQAASQGDGVFTLDIRLNDSSVSFDPKDSGPALKGLPAFRNFTSNFSILVRDGQTAQYTSATDPLSGETLKVDVTLNVLK